MPSSCLKSCVITLVYLVEYSQTNEDVVEVVHFMTLAYRTHIIVRWLALT